MVILLVVASTYVIFVKWTQLVKRMIEYWQNKGLVKTIHGDITTTLGKNAPSYATVKGGQMHKQHGRESLESGVRPGRPFTATTPDNTLGNS